MRLVGICIITEDVARLTRFYESVLQVEADGGDVHAVVPVGEMGIAIYAKSAAETDMGFDFSKYWGSGNFTISIDVDDVDVEYPRLQSLGVEFVTVPTLYPWGAKSVHFRDPDGDIVCFRTWKEA